ncbi:hypothetical protein L9F63_001674 [Diploptera punctata]|uniref:ATPase dynein-related AAA domain-containing protein n=1 Tax=Diploptera punctata TaxID=6984 RepID=A0AAD8A3K2_DIPPU|nr:hypothetical protein L9F63_001674 [Diploptera punctata]
MGQVQLDFRDIDSSKKIVTAETHFGIHPFYIKRGVLPTFYVRTTVLRGLQLNKPILLEGSPGFGKTSLVAALGYNLTRINLSEETLVSDSCGTDLPIECGDGKQCALRDGHFLRALKDGGWILLDELNLASQSVLEGLNACLDHRGEVFIPEFGKTFHIQSQSNRLFGAQNPLKQDDARKGLPQYFLNGFSQVYKDSITKDDLKFVIRSLFHILPDDLIYSMVMFNSRLAK